MTTVTPSHKPYIESALASMKYCLALRIAAARLRPHGFTASEIAEHLRLPDSLAAQWHAHGYYGTVSHNVKAIYQHYLSWYDGNPSNLNTLPPEMAGARYVEYMGGADAVLDRARRDFERGEYRWVAQVMNHLVFAQPTLREARELGAAALEQMGFQAESATWRNAFLLGARELREGNRREKAYGSRSADMVCAMTDEMFFDYLAIRLDGLKVQTQNARIDWHFTDTGRRYTLNVQHGALTCSTASDARPTQARVAMSRQTLDRILLGETNFVEAIGQRQLVIDGDVSVFHSLLESLDTFGGQFNVVEP